MTIPNFKKTIWEYYDKNKRDFPWRQTHDPYKILVSEVMLQQTQAPRVVPKYESFLKKFPNTKTLAQVSLSEVLKEWQGLGYNRRGMFLKKCAEKIESDFGGKFPKDFKQLCSLPGIGPATAGDILAFAWNIPVVVIETNIRSVFIHFFFEDKENISDKELLPLIEKTLDKENPRQWYWALFDFGSHLKETMENPGRRSKHYVKQSPFKGSNRQKRSQILKLILEKPRNEKEIQKVTEYETEIISYILSSMKKEGVIQKKGRKYFI